MFSLFLRKPSRKSSGKFGKSVVGPGTTRVTLTSQARRHRLPAGERENSEEVSLMKNNTTTKHADSCVASVRLRRAGRRLVAPVTVGAQGTGVSIATPIALPMTLPIALVRLAAVDAPFTGVIGVSTGATFAYKTSDVVRSLSGRPPV